MALSAKPSHIFRRAMKTKAATLSTATSRFEHASRTNAGTAGAYGAP